MWHSPQILVLYHLLAWSMATSLATVPTVSLTLRQHRLVGQLSTAHLRTSVDRSKIVPTALFALRGGSNSDGSFPLPSGTLGDESDENSLPTFSTSPISGTSLPYETTPDATQNGSSEALPAAMETAHDNIYATATTSPVPETLGLAASPPGWLRNKFPLWPWHKLPNALTVTRCLAIPLFMVVFYAPVRRSHVWASVLFALASATDYLDGYLARKWNVSTPFGAFLDPVVRMYFVACVTPVCANKQLECFWQACLSSGLVCDARNTE
jgi:CDP-alcohol phosphatidyltransferase